jgi:hypothetical protein
LLKTMTHFWFILLLNLSFFLPQNMTNATYQPRTLQTILADKKDHRRVVLLFGHRMNRFDLTVQEQRLAGWQPQLTERDMDVITVLAEELTPTDRQFLERNFRLNSTTVFIGWLIGKDGGIKQTFTRPIDPDDLCRLVDAMPMRQQEMKF